MAWDVREGGEEGKKRGRRGSGGEEVERVVMYVG